MDEGGNFDERVLVAELKDGTRQAVRLYMKGKKLDVETEGDKTYNAQMFFKEYLKEHIERWAAWKVRESTAVLRAELYKELNSKAELLSKEQEKYHELLQEHKALQKKYARVSKQHATLLRKAKNAKEVVRELLTPVPIMPPIKMKSWWEVVREPRAGRWIRN